MPKGDKGKYTDKQKRKAEHIEGRLRGSGRFEKRGQKPCLGHGE